MNGGFSDDPLQVYLYLARQVPCLTPDEELRCIEQAQASGPEQENSCRRLLEANLGLVIDIARQHSDDESTLLDLIQTGNRGLLKAIQSLNAYSSSESFAVHATPFIENELSHRSEP